VPLVKYKTSPKYYVDFNCNGRRRKWAVSTEKRAALEFERQLLRLIDFRAQGLPLPVDLLKWLRLQPDGLTRRLAEIGLTEPPVKRAPLHEYLEAYVTDLRNREVSSRYVQQLESRVKRAIDSGPLEPEHVQAVMAELRKSVSAATANEYLTSCKAFAAWLYDTGILPANPLARAKRLPILDRRQRRALTPAEVGRLLKVKSNLHDAYRLALDTGLRLGEIRRLSRDDFSFTGKNPHVRVRARVSKSKKAFEQPLPTAASKHWRKAEIPIFAPKNAAALMRIDLKAAKIRFETRDGRADFHALRHTYVTRLALAGVPPAVLQALARHADIRTTLTYYTHVDAAALRLAVDAVKFTLDA
jgi:integrase